MKILAIIPARANSNRLPGKNLKEINGKPLIEWTINQANKSYKIDRVVVNTDDPVIEEFCLGKVEVFKRSKEVSGDRSIYPVILDQLDKFQEYDIIVLLEPTSPLRYDDDIDNAIEKFLKGGKDSLASIGKMTLEAPNCYFPYGVIYISKIDALKKYKTFYQHNMDFYLIEDWQCEEIDTILDFIKVEAIMKSKKYDIGNL